MRFQVNAALNTLANNRKPDKGQVAQFNNDRNWSTIEGTVETLVEEIKKGNTFRLCEKVGGNGKANIIGISGIGLDIDYGDYSLAKTLSHPLLQNVNYIVYLSFNGVVGEDKTPHRLIFPFSTDSVSVEVAERVNHFLHNTFTGGEGEGKKTSTFDAGRLWFATSIENLESIQYVDNGTYLDTCFNTEPETVSADELEPLDFDSLSSASDTLQSIKKISQVAPKIDKNSKADKKNKGKSLRERLDLFWSNWVIENNLNPAITRIIGYDLCYKTTTRDTPGKSQLDGGHWHGSLDGSAAGASSDSTTLTLMVEGNFTWYDRRTGEGSNFVTFLYNAYHIGLDKNFPVSMKISNGELLKFTKERCQELEIESPDLTLTPEELWQFYVADSKGSLYYMANIRSYALYKKQTFALNDGIGVDYKDRIVEYQYCWALVAPRDLVDAIDGWANETFGSHVSAKHLRDLKTLAELGTSQVEKLAKFPIDAVLPVKGGKLWHFGQQKLIEASNRYFYWNPSTMPFLEGDKEQEIGQAFIDLLKLITPEKEHYKIPVMLKWIGLWLAGRAYNTQFALYLWGQGGAGKSTICQWLRSMVGSDLVETRENTLLRSDLRFGNERLLQTTRALFNEFKGDAIKNTNLPFLKDIIAAAKAPAIDANGCVIPGVYTGGTSIEVEIKFGGQSTGFARLGVLMNGQNLPIVPETDEGWPRRFMFVEFRLAQARTDLFEKIGANLPYLRSWLLKQDLIAADRDLEVYIRDPKTLHANRALLHGNSPMGQFIESYLEITPDDYATPFSEVYTSWAAYCDMQKIKPGSIGRFLLNLETSLKAMGLITSDTQFWVEKRDTHRNNKKFLMLKLQAY